MKSYGVTIQMKATEKYFPVVLFIMLYKVFLTFESVDEIQWSDHSKKATVQYFRAVLPFECVNGKILIKQNQGFWAACSIAQLRYSWQRQ